MFEGSRLDPLGLDRPLAQCSTDVGCDSLHLNVPILGREDINEAYYRPLHHGMAFYTIHNVLHSIGVHYYGQGFSYLVPRSSVIGGLLLLLSLQCVP